MPQPTGPARGHFHDHATFRLTGNSVRPQFCQRRGSQFITDTNMWDDVSANKSLIGNERETPSTRSQLSAHSWLLNVVIWAVRPAGKRIPCMPGALPWLWWLVAQGGCVLGGTLTRRSGTVTETRARMGGTAVAVTGALWQRAGCIRRVATLRRLPPVPGRPRLGRLSVR